MEVLIFLIFCYVIYYSIDVYNKAVPLVEQCKEYSSNIQTEQKRKVDLFNSFLDTISNGGVFEKELITDIVKLRSDTHTSTDEKLSRIQGMFSRVENYPNVQSTSLYLTFQQNISETENRIQNSKALYNQTVAILNSYVKKFPTNIVCIVLGINAKDYVS